MKKLLIATSAFVAAASIAGAAQAADPLKLSLGGYANFFAGVAQNDDDYLDGLVGGMNDGVGQETKGLELQDDAEIHFKAATTLDNGIDISFKYEMETQGTKNDDEISATVGTAYGAFIIGEEDAPTEMIYMGAPDMSAGIGFEGGDVIDGEWVDQPNGWTAGDEPYIDALNDGQKLTYLSPTFAGFTLGATFAPDGATDGAAKSSLDTGSFEYAVKAGNTTLAADLGQAYGVGAMYNGEFSGVSLGFEAAYAISEVNGVQIPGTPPTALGNLVDEYTAWQVGTNVGYAGFTFGAAYVKENVDLNKGLLATVPGALGGTGAATQDPDKAAWNVGIAYETGPYGVSLGYQNAKADNVDSAFDDEESDLWQLGAKYEMGPGVVASMALSHVEFDVSQAPGVSGNGVDNDGWAVITGLNLSF